MKRILHTALLLACFGMCQAQDSIRISGQFLHNARFAKVVVKKFNVGSFDIAAVPIQKDGRFNLSAPKDLEAGVYRFQYSQSDNNAYVDVIIDGKEKNISFSIDLLNEDEKRKPIFTQSQENQNWYRYQNQSQLQLQKITALQQALALYPNTTDKIISQLQKATHVEQSNYKTQETAFLMANKNTWAANMVANKPVYFTNSKEDWRLQDFAVRAHFWDNINTSNPALINSPIYTEHILNYLKYYMNPEMNFIEEEMNEGFKKSVDTIVHRFSGNPETNEFAIKYLQLGFKEIGNEKILQYIDENYKGLLAQCQDDSDKVAFEQRMASYAALKPGTMAPEINFVKEGKTIGIQDITTDYTVVAFWASWCPNCEEQMPLLESFLANHTNVTVLAVSLDNDQVAYSAAIQKYPSMLHSCDFKKWESKPVKDYFIYGSPTFVVLDKEHKIIDKLVTAKAVMELIEKK
jgi:thiol-disulfide isomerase/thioredoxin